MRWIDFGFWELVSDNVNPLRAMQYTIGDNITHVLRWERWELMLRREETAAHETMRKLLTFFIEDALEDLKLTRRSEPSSSLMARALNWLGHSLNTQLCTAEKQTPECRTRAQVLLGDIESTAARYYHK
jgi:hypothetical protein